MFAAPGVIIAASSLYFFASTGFATHQPTRIGRSEFLFANPSKYDAEVLSPNSNAVVCNIAQQAKEHGLTVPPSMRRGCSSIFRPEFTRITPADKQPTFTRLTPQRARILVEAHVRARHRNMAAAQGSFAAVMLLFAALWFGAVWTIGWIVRGFTEPA